MKKVFILFTLLISSLCPAQTQVDPGRIGWTLNPNTNIKAGTIAGTTTNGTQIVGNGPNSTIQAAVNAGGAVEIPASVPVGEQSYPASEIAASPIATSSYTNTGTVRVDDARPLNHDSSLAQMFNLPSLDGQMEGGDMGRLAKCIQKGVCNLALVGNSIHENISGIAPDDGYFPVLVAELRRRFPGVTWNAINLSIGGSSVENFNDATYTCASSGANTFFRNNPGMWYIQQTYSNQGLFIVGPPYLQWPNGCVNGSSWKAHLAAFSPDAVILGFVENEWGVGSNNYAGDLYAAITYVKGLATPATTVILTTDEPPNPAWYALVGVDPAVFEGLNETTRGVASQCSVLLADADRYYNVLAYGIDPARRHYQVEHAFGTMSGVAYPTGWAGATGFTGTMPTMTSSGLSATVVFAAGNFSMIQRTRNALDFTLSETFGGLSASSVPSVWYRMDNNQVGYKVQDQITTSGTNFVHTISLWYSPGTGTTQVGLASGSCTLPASSSIALTVEVTGTRHRVWCNTAALGNFVKVIDTFAYQKVYAGALALGVQAAGGTISNEYAYYGNPTQYFTPLVSIPSMLGTNAPPNAYSGTGDFDTNPYSFGGDGLHHPNPLGMDTYYLASFKPVMDQLSQLVPKTAYMVTASGVSNGPLGGLQDSQAGQVDFVDGPTGARIANNAGNVVLEAWDDSITDPHIFNRPITAPAVNGVSAPGLLSAGNVAFTNGAGTSPTAISIAGTDASFLISFTTGSNPAGMNGIFTVTFTTPRGHVTYCQAQPASATAAALSTGQTPWVFSFSAASMSLASNGALTAGTAYSWAVSCP